jgi:DNA-binding MarR family transcriptional regulator
MKGEDTLRLLAAAMLFRRGAGLTGLENLVLHAVAVEEGRCLAQLGAATALTPDQVTKVCHRLVGRQFIELRPHPTDVRKKLVYLAPAGRTYIMRLLRTVTRARRPD